ncbi:F0F1 ATP synthase subunit epsilon [Congregibacter variabilis]|uniref:ATP synthase epsilon chain n=1 Tax=Congregibacter variabilis TaxID=3081200 RepID=A0ABZ0I231_9GAMM|nr:F0F1 ATP synthase subunit epsilon [Congregibacter sp. IMCC43200]
MHLRLMLPTEVLIDEQVIKIIAEAENGSFCLLPRHADFVSSLVPGVLYVSKENGEEVFAALDHGILVKCGDEVLVSTVNAVRGDDLEKLKSTVAEQFLTLSDHERIARSALARLEAGTIRRFIELEAQAHA